MVKEGRLYAAVPGALAIALGILVNVWVALPFVVCSAFCAYFFRDPERVIPSGSVCVAPADGRVVQVRGKPDGKTRVSIFLSIFDVHMNRIPISGRVRSVNYSPGTFSMAHLKVASITNEKNTLVIEERDGGSTVEVSQIAGLIARRIVCRKKAGDHVEKGERFGLIRFGSRVDVVLGPEWRLAVTRGDRVAGGRSVLAERL